MADIGQRITRELTIRYVAVLVVLGVLAIGSFLGLGRMLQDSEDGAAVVNLAGRQRMLVERSAFLATRVAVQSPASPALRNEFLSILDLLESQHTGLLQGVPERKGRRTLSAQLRALYFGPDLEIDRDLRAYIEHGRAFAAGYGTDHLLAMHRAADGPLLEGLDRITACYQEENEQRLIELFGYHGGALIITLLMLLLSAFGVFHPMVECIRHDMAERELAEKGLRDSEERLWRILEECPVGVSVSRRSDGRVVFANTRFCEIIGARKSEVIGASARGHYVDDEQRRNVIGTLRRQGRIDDQEVEFLRRDGTPFWSLLTLGPTHFEGEPVNLAWVYDISGIKAAEERLKLTAKVVETASEGVVITNAKNEIEFVNPAFTKITEYSFDEVLGQNPKMLRSGRHDRQFYKDMWKSLKKTGRWRGEVWNRRKSGEFYAEWLSIVAIRDEAGNLSHYIAVFSDITHRKEDEQRVWRQANYDALTGLPNRSLFVDRLSQAVRQSRRDSSKFALMFIDLDGFKLVNDTLGHAAGDALLQQTAARLGDCIRSSDTVARLAGDEFTIIMQGIKGREDARLVAAKIIDVLAAPFDLDAGTASIRGSIGIAVFPDNAPDGLALLKLADDAMYHVKKHGKNNFEFVDDAFAGGSG